MEESTSETQGWKGYALCVMCLISVFIPTGQMDLNSKQLVTSLISSHLSVVLWFVEMKLLPENDGKYLSLNELFILL